MGTYDRAAGHVQALIHTLLTRKGTFCFCITWFSATSSYVK